MSSLGHIPTEENLKKMMEEVDKDNSGAIEFTEFCHLMAKNMKDADNEEDLMEAFNRAVGVAGDVEIHVTQLARRGCFP